MSCATREAAGPKITHDDHVHAGAFSGHAAAFPLSELREAGLRCGLRVSLREHAPLPPAFLAANPDALVKTAGLGFPVGLRTGEGDNLDAFFAEVASAELPLGFEIDALPPGWLPDSLAMIDQLERRAAAHGLRVECFNLSHHYPWDMSFGGLARALAAAGGARPFLKSYFATLRAYASTGRFGAVSHLEAIRKFDGLAGTQPPFAGEMALYPEEIGETLAVLQRFDMALEYNTNGNNYWGQPFISHQTLERAIALGVRLTVGSDAHRPAAVGQGFAAAATALAAAGVTHLYTFRLQQAIAVPLSLAAPPPAYDR